jgi:protein involved in ribonucleotide reduction
MNKLFKKLHGCKFCKGCKMVANDIQTPFVAVFEFPPLQVDYYHVAKYLMDHNLKLQQEKIETTSEYGYKVPFVLIQNRTG